MSTKDAPNYTLSVGMQKQLAQVAERLRAERDIIEKAAMRRPADAAEVPRVRAWVASVDVLLSRMDALPADPLSRHG